MIRQESFADGSLGANRTCKYKANDLARKRSLWFSHYREMACLIPQARIHGCSGLTSNPEVIAAPQVYNRTNEISLTPQQSASGRWPLISSKPVSG
jgi:hypothetical protein